MSLPISTIGILIEKLELCIISIHEHLLRLNHTCNFGIRSELSEAVELCYYASFNDENTFFESCNNC